ncbi:elongation of very long chain fatty acids protein 6-like isoform X2 [Penaeus chinensis]|uniref:elongation of very long chain fatty acids protein 6-like isoform X2 n=1 Tax=Penaeus chinensis TaxID=139456 RepID=UPI001FB5A2AA|nr:elongation of very long chain fatty acids protein 6-like isoform X2 [Penaeus chinensis]
MESVTMPNYSYVFKFEEDFDTLEKRRWMRENWMMCFYYIGAYMIVIYGGQLYMQTRPRFELRIPLFMWNVFLAVFSIWGAYRSAPELLYVLNNHGFHYSVCIPGPSLYLHPHKYSKTCEDTFDQICFLDNRVGGFWNWMFTLSKVPELGDTVFIVLRKQPLIFLHWYHHVTVLLYAWYSYSDYIATARWFVCMNYLVHSVMYSYYALKALKFRVPRWISMGITTAQLAQMVMGAAVNIWAYQVKQAGNECHVSYDNIKISLLMYISYFVLFAHFFCRAYVVKSEKQVGAAQDKKGSLAYEGKSTKGKVE